MYDYYEAVERDIREYLDTEFIADELETIDADDVYDMLWGEDCVTGNGDYGYFSDSSDAMHAVGENLELLSSALYDFGNSVTDISKGADFCDTIIRCAVFSNIFHEVLDNFIKEKQEERESWD